MHPLITPAELAERLGSPTLRLFDCTTFLHPQPGTHRMRVETGQRGYDEGHIPGAALIDLQADLSDPANSLRFTAPAPDDLARRFQALGVGDDTEVVLYSASDAWWATRVWWLLRAIGMDRAAVLGPAVGATTLKQTFAAASPPGNKMIAKELQLAAKLVAARQQG